MKNCIGAGAQVAPNLPELLDEKQIAKMAGLTVRGIQSQRRHGGGFKWIRISKNCVRYPLADALAFLASRPSGGGERPEKK
jgi:hypothetical protein